jgi:riboflavin synthase
MFTGIIEEMGAVKTLSVRGESGRLAVTAQKVLADVRQGDSIAVNGVCLTVVAFSAREFTADVMPETLRKTNLGNLRPGDPVNLERAMALGGRLGGHLVSGHIDGTGRVVERREEGNAIIYRISTIPDVLRYVIPKGSVAIDGISLTVADVGMEWFSVSLIPHTASITTMGTKNEGDLVNLENDMIGKYVDRLLQLQHGERQKEEISMEFLKANGFLQ